MKHTFFWGLLLLSALGACTENSKLEKNRASCYVRYLAPEGQLQAEFKLTTVQQGNETPQPTEVPDGPYHQGVLMSVVPSSGFTYRLEQPGGYAADHRFDWKNKQGQAQTFSMSMSAIQSFSFEPKVLSNKKPATLRWLGQALEQGESIVMMWESTDGGLTVPMEIIGSPGQKQIDFPAAQMAKLPAGEWTLYLVRKKRVKAEVNGTTTSGMMEYYTQVDTLTVN